MADRTFKVWGQSFSNDGSGSNITVVITWDGTQVYNGTISSLAGVEPEPPITNANDFNLCNFTGTTAQTGNIALTITPTGGDIVFRDITANYIEGTVDKVDGVYPVDADGYYVWSVDPSTVYGILNTNTTDSDGKTNITYSNTPEDFEEIPRAPADDAEAAGEWPYSIPDGATFSCNFTVDIDRTVVSWNSTDDAPSSADHP